MVHSGVSACHVLPDLVCPAGADRGEQGGC